MPGIVQPAQSGKIIRHQYLCQSCCRGQYLLPSGRVQIILVSGRRPYCLLHLGVGGAEVGHQCHLFFRTKALSQPGLRSMRVAEIVEEDVHHIVEIFGPARIQPHLTLPRRARKRDDRRDDM